MKNLFLTCACALLSLAASASCNPQFSWSHTPNSTSLLRITLNNTSTFSGAPTNSWPTYTYNYGDGTPVSYSTIHSYSSPGTYNVKLHMQIVDSMTQAVYCYDSAVQSITVNYPPCGATIGYTLNQSMNGQVTFTATNPANTPGLTYSWNFGDGNTGTGSPVTHTYASNGNRTVTLTVTLGGTNPCTYTTSVNINVNNVMLNCSNAHALFNWSVNNNTVNFYNFSTSVAGYTRQYQWSFGDGNTAQSANPVHTYSTAGTYTVKLKTTWISNATSTPFCTDSVVHTVVTSNPPNMIYGHIVIDSLPVTPPQYDTFKVWLIQYNSATNALTAVDSLRTGGSGGAGYAFHNKPAGNYLVKAHMVTGPTSGFGYVPTYHDSSLYWGNALSFSHAGGYTGSKIIWMKKGTITNGPGFIGGNVSLGANKGTSGGVPGMAVFLRDQQNTLIASAITDANGDFSISNIPLGTYSLYPEQMNYTTIPYTVTIAAGQTSLWGINFRQDDVKMNIMAHPTGIRNTLQQGQLVRIYPNPTRGTATLSWEGFPMKDGRIVISNLTGQQVLTRSIASSGNAVTLDLSSLQAGVYFVHLTSEQAETTLKLVVQQ